MNISLNGTFARILLAFMLAFGLMIPTSALATGTANSQETVTPPHVKLEESDSPNFTTEDLTDSSDIENTNSLPIVEPQAETPRIDNPFDVRGGTGGNTPGQGDWYFDALAGTLHIQTSTPLTISTTGEVSQNIEIDAGVKADLTLNNVTIVTPSDKTISPINLVNNVYDISENDGKPENEKQKATSADQIRNKTMLYLTLADKSNNTLKCANAQHAGTGTWGAPAIHCGWGSVLVIDDSIRNIDNSNNLITPVNGLIGSDVVLSDGKTTLKAGDPLSKLDSKTPGNLTATGGSHSAGIGSGPQENAGTLIINGGNLTVDTSNITEINDGNNSGSSGAAIGSGDGGSGTTIIINGGSIDAQAAYHGAGIGAGWGWIKWYELAPGDAIAIPTDNDQGYGYYSSSSKKYYNVAGDIFINGGFIRSKGAAHGNAFGMGCTGSTVSNRNHIIRITGGTLLPSSAGDRYDIGGESGYTIVTGGSVHCPIAKFQGIGNTAYNTNDVSAWNDVINKHGGQLPDTDKVFEITINLASEIKKRNEEAGITDNSFNERISSWNLKVGDADYPYGAPCQFDEGKLYLWLPSSATKKEITVDLSYTDKKGNEQTIEPLFRIPDTAQGGTTLKRYISFTLPEGFNGLSKYYDGTPLEGLHIDENNTLPTADKKVLKDPAAISYKYILCDRTEDGTLIPYGVESESSKAMPSNAGVMKLTVDSSEWSGDSDFSANYWGHRAIGECEIKPTTSTVDLIEAKWSNNQQGHIMNPSDMELTITANISHAKLDPDGFSNKETCKAPEGRVQLYMDKKAVGDPIELLFEDAPTSRAVTQNGKKNADRISNGAGSYTHFSYTFKPSEMDFLVPDAKDDNKHIVSLQYLPPEKGSPAPANYLESVNPAKDPKNAPQAEIAIEPIDPKTSVTAQGEPNFTPPLVALNPNPTPDDPNADPTKAGNKTYTGTVTTTYDLPTDDIQHPGRVTLNLHTDSSGPISITDADGNLFNVEFIKDESGNPKRNDDGSYTLLLDPKDIGDGKLTIKQDPNGAYTGTTWLFDVKINPNPKAAPSPLLTKQVENLTHPEGPTQPGDRLRYTLSASNTTPGSAWTQVIVQDPLPSCLDLDESTLRLDNPKYDLEDIALSKVDTITATDTGNFALSDRGTSDRAILSVPTGTVYGNTHATITFECVVKNGLDFSDTNLIDLANTANASGKRLNPDNPNEADVDLDPEPSPEPGKGPNPVTPPVTPPGGKTVAPSDPNLDNIITDKKVENITNPNAKVTKIGDHLRYTISLSNTGSADTALYNTVITDPLPTGFDLVPSSMQLVLGTIGSDTLSETISVPETVYDKSSHTVSVTVGDLWGGHSVSLIFECIVNKEAVGLNNTNIASILGDLPSKDPGHNPSDPTAGGTPGDPVNPPSDDKPIKSTPPATPPTLLPLDPSKGDVTIHKVAENTTSNDDNTYVGDIIHYTITLSNSAPSTGWMDTVIRDDVPEGLEILCDSIHMTLPDKNLINVSDKAYNVSTRCLSISTGRLYGGQSIQVTFDALVTEDALDADIGNIAVALGKLPSKWDPDTEGQYPNPGEPFIPASDWEEFGSDNEKVESVAAYPPGTDSTGGVLAAKKNIDASGTIMAKTSDTTIVAITIISAIMLISLGVLIYSRRLRKKS